MYSTACGVLLLDTGEIIGDVIIHEKIIACNVSALDNIRVTHAQTRDPMMF